MDKKFDCDVLVVGSGASGMATAITAKLLGLNVVVIEKLWWYHSTLRWVVVGSKYPVGEKLRSPRFS